VRQSNDFFDNLDDDNHAAVDDNDKHGSNDDERKTNDFNNLQPGNNHNKEAADDNGESTGKQGDRKGDSRQSKAGNCSRNNRVDCANGDLRDKEAHVRACIKS
jgi:hypothetical protein